MKPLVIVAVICASLGSAHGQRLQSKTEDDIATILATIIAAERLGCIDKKASERLIDNYQRHVNFRLGDYTPMGREADRMELHLQRAFEFDRAKGRKFTCKAMREVLTQFY